VNRPKAVLFDAGHTLVFIDGDRTRAAFAEEGVEVSAEGFGAAERVARTRLTGLVREGHLGTERELWHEYFVTLFRTAGVPEDRLQAVSARIRTLHEDQHLWTGVDPRTPEALETLLDRGFRLAVISNADGRMEDALVRAGLRGHFEFVLDSEIVGISKPEAGIFHAATELLEMEPAECLYVGDLYPVDFLGARGAGMQAVLLDPHDMLDYGVDRIPTVAHLPGFLDRADRSRGPS